VDVHHVATPLVLLFPDPIDDLFPGKDLVLVLQEQLKDVLATLPAREQEVLKMRFGLEDGYSLTLEEVGLYFEVTRERIRQIEAKALRRLRHPKRSRKLKDFI